MRSNRREDEETRQDDKEQQNDHEEYSYASFVISLTHSQKPDQINDDCQDLNGLAKEEKKVEELILLTNAGPHPRAMMVKSSNALIATMAVLDS